MNNGEHTLFWLDKWLSSTTLQSLSNGAIPEDELGKSVVDYWGHVQGWKTSLVANLLASATMEILCQYQLRNNETREDKPIWTLTKNKYFSVK